MGFYDEQIKSLYMRCPRLVILSINSIFGKHYAENAEVVYLNRELPGNEGEHAKYMDMLLEIEECKYHLEFQLLEDYMAIRMYEYAVRETMQDVATIEKGRRKSRYELHVTMPQQAVIFLAGANKQDHILVHLTLPDGKTVEYSLPCVSAAETVEELIERKLFLLVPFQQVQMTKKLSRLKDDQDKHIKTEEQRKRMEQARHLAAQEVLAYRRQVKSGLEKMTHDAIITEEERDVLGEVLKNIEEYMLEASSQIDQEVSTVGDEDYVCWSDRMRNEGRVEGRAEGRAEGEAKERTRLVLRYTEKGKSLEEIADLLDISAEEVRAIQEKALATV